jgi:hypothetical protein
MGCTEYSLSPLYTAQPRMIQLGLKFLDCKATHIPLSCGATSSRAAIQRCGFTGAVSAVLRNPQDQSEEWI